MNLTSYTEQVLEKFERGLRNGDLAMESTDEEDLSGFYDDEKLKQFLTQTIKETAELAKNWCRGEFTTRLNEYANRPLDKRKNSFDEMADLSREIEDKFNSFKE